MKKWVCSVCVVLAAFSAYAQEKQQSKTLPLDDMSAFRAQAGNWRVVGDVTMNPGVDIHAAHKEEVPAGTKKKKSKSAATAESPKAVVFREGKGILLNMNDDKTKDNLVTNLEHGDIELELEVMLPKGSNSGIYLQGRYEVQLLDSWGVKSPTFGDIGGIYRNWETEAGKIYMGKAPLSNAAKAPGLWQKMRISFRAPRFDAAGKKIANAMFTSVDLNGVRIHDHLEVPLPTGGPLENNEVATGPLMIQGDHGPVAFRNIRYRPKREGEFSVTGLTYKTYYGNFKTTNDFAALKPAATGSLEQLTCEILENENEYGAAYTGNIVVPEDGDYHFTIVFTGGGKLTIKNQELVNMQRGDGFMWERKTIRLEKGSHPFEILNFKTASWMAPRLGLFVETDEMYSKPLHAFNSFPPDDNPVSPILINSTGTPKMLRGFIDFKNDRSRRLTHTIGVGENGLNYIFDLKAGNLVCVWRGSFADATPMWHDRGDGSFRPQGAAQYLFTGQPLAFLANEQQPFPAVSKEDEFKGKGYQLDASSSRPTFKYVYRDLEVNDQVYPEDENRVITHEVQIKGNTTAQGLYYKIGEGSSLEQMPDGSYAVDDKQYYIRIHGGVKPFVREIDGKKELVIRVQNNTVKYSLVW